jgi:hypothetical protein
MKLRTLCAALVILLFGATVAHAQFWEEKDWKTWSKGDCEKMLKDSPWARSFENSIYKEGPGGLASAGGTGTGTGTGTGGTLSFAGDNRASLKYTVQLRSALPIRQAVVRLAMIQNKYDKMSTEEKKDFDRHSQEYLDQDFSNRIVVHVTYESNLQELDRWLAEFWQKSPTAAMPITGDLITPKGDRIRPVRFISDVGASREFELIFAKEVDNEPYIREVDTGFSVELPDIPQQIADRFRGGRRNVQTSGRDTQETEKRALVQFDLRKMKFQDRLEY